MNPNQANTIDTVTDIFVGYLEDHNLRKTPERIAILHEIYGRSDHFEAETLYLDLRNNKVNVSRATVYNTLELLLGCNLIRKHQFGKSQAQYEKSYGYNQHDHLICEVCDKVVEFCDPRIHQIETMIGDLLGFKVKDHSLILYGECDKTCEHYTNKKALK